MGAQGGLEPCTGSAGEEAGGGAGQEAQTLLDAENSPGCSRPGTPQPPTQVPDSGEGGQAPVPAGGFQRRPWLRGPGQQTGTVPLPGQAWSPAAGQAQQLLWLAAWLGRPTELPRPSGSAAPPGRPACPNTGRARLHPAPTGMTALGRKGHPGFARAVCTPVCLAHARAEWHLLVRRAPRLPPALPWPQGAGRSTGWHLIPALPPAPALRTEAAKGTREAQPPGLVHTPTRHGPCRVRRGAQQGSAAPGEEGAPNPYGAI